MNDRLYSVDQVAERLGLHVRTVRNYVRDGRLPAVRIGKQYRIAHDDLEAFTGRPVPATAAESAGRERRTEVSCVVEVDAVDPTTAHRLSTALTSTGPARTADDPPLRVQTAYDEARGHMKIIIWGGPGETARLLDYVEGVLGS